MYLFTTQLESIQSQIEALQAERNRLQDLENATAGALANLKAVVANVDDVEAIALLKSAINALFEEDSKPEKVDTQQPEFGTPERPCPATTTGECFNPECESETFVCEGCGKETPYCYGGDGDELCNDCWTSPKDETDDLTKEKIQELKKIREEKAAPQFKKMFDSEPDPDPDDCDLVIYSDQVHRYKNTLGVHFKLKRDAKKWLEIFELKYPECRVEVNNDEYEKFKYLLTVIKPDGNDPKWWETVSKFNYSQPPTVSGQANAPIEPQKPAVHQTLPHIVLDEEAADSDFVFIATGQGWQKVIHNGEVLGVIYSNPSGWELENGDQFETREEAATALFNSTPSAA